jgi:beta-glucosidase
MQKLFLFILTFSLSLFAVSQNIDQQVDSLLNLMTLEEKIGQMTQAERGMLEKDSDIAFYKLGSLLSGGGSSPDPNNVTAWANMYDGYQSYALQTRLAIPLIYGVDAVHGHNNVYGAVMFPHNIGMGCTWNPELVKTANEITAREVAATGIDWNFSPCIAVPQNERWGRTYEGFGETAELQKMMAAASVEGLQGDDLSAPETILACAKHFVGDGGTINGIDQGNTVVTESVLRELHMAGYIDAINQNVGTIMASYNSWNGQKLHGHEYLLTDVLKEELGFEGFIISDWKGVDQVDEDYREAVKRSINAGVDMVMVPDRYIYFISILKDLVENNEVSMERIDDAVRRILKQKFLLNLFEEPYADPSFIPSVGAEQHRAVARQAVRESTVVLAAKNNVLPLQKNGQKILVAGRRANDLGAQCGGWSISWQGSNGAITEGTNILEGIQQMAETSEVTFSENGETSGTFDIAVVVIGEDPYAEGAGDRTDLSIHPDDASLIKRLKEKGIPVVAILVSGRPMIIGESLASTDAFIAAWLPGTEGDGLAEVLFGDYEPSGRLTHTWPATMNQVPINLGDDNYTPLFAYKHGIQGFPGSMATNNLLPYAATLNNSGDLINLYLTDNITAMDAAPEDFEVKVNGTSIADLVSTIAVSATDNSMLEINLGEAIESATAFVTISYTGDGIYASDLQLEQFADHYVFKSLQNPGAIHSIPGKVQAEDYFDMYGIQTEPCTDIGNGLNVGYIEDGDWMKYNLEVTSSGKYEFLGRFAGYNSTSMHFTFNDTIFAEISFTATDGWQNWEDFTTTVELEKGSYVMKAQAHSDGYNVNYFNFTLLTTIDENQPDISEIVLYPNPVSRNFSIDFLSLTDSEVSINVFDMTGKRAQALYRGKVDPGLNRYSFELDANLPKGLYFIEIKDGEKRYFERIVKQ